MPNGKTHAMVTLAGAVAVPSAMAAYGFPTPEVLSCSIGFLVSLAINPDLDIKRKISFEKPARIPWTIIWWPYACFFKHRSIWTHAPLIGTTLRIAYLMVILAVVLRSCGISMDVISSQLYWILYGLVLSDIIHILMDLTSTMIKRRL